MTPTFPGSKFDGPKFDDKRLAELKEEVETLSKAVLEASRARLTFDDDPANFASLLAREAK
jgi:hypothetical protein